MSSGLIKWFGEVTTVLTDKIKEMGGIIDECYGLCESCPHRDGHDPLVQNYLDGVYDKWGETVENDTLAQTITGEEE